MRAAMSRCRLPACASNSSTSRVAVSPARNETGAAGARRRWICSTKFRSMIEERSMRFLYPESVGLPRRLMSSGMPDHPVSTAAEIDRVRLFEVWEASVRATHHFLAEADIQFLLPLAREELARLAPVHCIRGADGRVCAFMIVEQKKIEALFVAPEQHGKGAGRALVEVAVRSLGASSVPVHGPDGQAGGV